MKRRGIHSANCSCTSCVYRSRSKQPSVQQLIEEGSRIDKLYYGKYLPLRERKLLEKLIRTRAVYDDVRNQLLSTSGSSDQARSEHKIKKRRGDDDSTEKSSAVLKMVDLVDRGQIGSPNASKLSSCCSCCSCSSLRKIKKYMEKHPARVHRHHVPYEDIARYTVAAEERGRRRRRRLSTKISSKIRTVHFKMKKIRSEPCTCTLSLSSVMKRPSKAFIQKIRSRENEAANVQAQKVVTVERKPLKEKICSCSCKIAQLPMKSIQKIKNIRKSTTKSSGTDMGNQKAFKIRKDSLTLFRDKLLKKRAYKDWECELGTCVVDECIPEQCFKKIKAKGVGERRRVKYQNRISGSGIDNRVSISTRAKKVKRIDSKMQATPGSSMGPVICECKPTTKSTSSMTSFPKSKSLVKIKSTIKEKTDKARRHTPKRTESYESYDTERVPVQSSPKNKLVPVICECKPEIKSTHSMTTVKTEIRKKRPATPKQRPQYVVKETVKQEKVYKTGRYEKELVQVSPGPNLGHVTCECKPYTKSISSMTTIPKAKVSKTMKSKPRPQQLFKETVIQEKEYKAKRDATKQAGLYSAEREQALPVSKLGSVICDCKPPTESVYSMTSTLKTQATQSVSKTDIKVRRPITPKQRPRKESIRYEKAYKTGLQKELVQVSPKSNLGYATCKCPSTKSVFSSTSTRKTTAGKHRKPKPGLQIVIQEEKVYKTNRRKSNQIKQIKSHEIQIVKGSPKPKLGNIICECKPMTKSTSSMTTISKSKTKTNTRIPKKYKVHRPDSYKPRREPYEYHETEQEQPEKQAVKISSSFKFEIEFSKKKYPALNNKEIIEQVLDKRAKRIKPTQTRKRQYKKYQNSKIQVTGAKSKSSHESQLSYLRESASQTSKPYHDIILPFPRECESSMCIPYECDPKSCARILLSRSKSRGRSVTASTDRLRHKSAGSTTLSLKTNSKSRYVQSKSIESFVSYPREPLKESPTQKPVKDIHLETSHPQKQAVRITSSFNFNIEFYKESPEVKTNDVKQVASVPQREIKQTLQRKKYKERGHRARNINSRHFSSQSKSSQSFKNIQVGHRLKRCFCTLKLLQKKKQIKEVERRAHIEATQTKSSGIAYVTPPVTSHPKSTLHPCECSSSDRHPCECSEGIKERKETNITSIPSKSQSRRRQKKAKRVRVSHSKELQNHTVYDKPTKKEKRRMQPKGVKVHKAHVRHAASLTSKNIKGKQTYTTPFLEKCFCTLKLFKKNKEKAGNVTPFSRRNDYIVHMQNKSITNNRAKIKNHHEPLKRPYECECEPVPVECDPYKCKKMARRHMKLQHKHSTTGDHATRSTFSGTFSGTSRTVTSSKSRNTQSYIKGSGDKATKNTDKIITKPSHSNRQAVRVGSNFSFNIEFYKENSSANRYHYTDNINTPEVLPQKRPHDKHIKKYNHKINKLKTTGSQQLKHRSHHKAITAEAKHKERGVSVGSAIKRCFCTLKFHKTGTDTKLQRKIDVTNKSTKTSYPLPNPQICECKSTSTKIGKPVYDLKSYECPPGMCNPYECYEELKRREIKRLHNQHINTDRNRRKSAMSMTTTEFTLSSKTKSTQSRLLKKTSKRDHKLRALQEDVRSTRSIAPSRQAVNLGSNFSFNVEFFKERSVTSAQKTAHRIRHEDFSSISSRTIKKDRATKDKRLILKNRFSQSMIRKDDKAANVGFILKRCFCTLGLQKKRKPQHEFGNYPPITVQIVQMDRNPKNTCNSVFPHIKRTEELNIVNSHNMIKPRYGSSNKAIYEKESLKFNRPEDIYPFKKSIFDLNQNLYHLPQYLGHFRSRIDFNVGEYQVGNLVIDAQEANPFYQSFYALNVKVSKLKNLSGDTHALGDHECAPGVCVPYECEPAKCLKLINDRVKLTKTSGSERPKTKSVGTTNKLQSKSVTTESHLNNNKRKLNYKDNSCHCRGRRNSKVRSVVNIGLSKNTKPRTDGLKFSSPHKPELTKDIATRQSVRHQCCHQGRHHDAIISHESQKKAKSLLEKCLCPIRKLTETNFKSYKLTPSQQGHSYRKQLRLGTDLSLGMGFYKDTSSGGDNALITSSPRVEAGKYGQQSSRSDLTYVQNNPDQNKAKSLIAKCLCPIKKITETHLTPYINRPSQNSCLSCGRSQRSSLPSQRAWRVGSDFSISMKFYKDRNPRRNGFMVSTSPKSKRHKDVASRQAIRVETDLHRSKHDKNIKCDNVKNSQKNNEHQYEAVAPKKSLLAKCLCPVKKISDIQSTIGKQKPRQNKNIHLAHKVELSERKSNLNIARPCNFCKDTNYHNEHLTGKDAATKHGDSKINDKSKKSTSGLSQFITKCFCTPKQKTKTKKATKTEKAGNSKNDKEPEKKVSKKKAKVQNDKGTIVDHLNHKSTSSSAKKSKSTKTKTVESKPTNYSTYSKYSASHNRIDHGINNRASVRRAVSFGSNISFSMEFINSSSTNGSLSSVFHQSKPGTQINQGARVSPVYFSKIEETGYNRPKTADPEQYCVTKGKKYKKNQDTVKRKFSKKEIKSILKPCECEPRTGTPNKCVSIECDKNTKKRHLRSKTTKVARDKKATSIKSAVMDRGTATKGKRLTKSFDQCNPQNCEKKMKVLGTNHPDVGKTTKQKAKTPQKEEKELKSALKTCYCTLSPEQSTIKQKKTKSKRQTDLNKFIQKCFCTLKSIKGGKGLTSKPSIERITDSHKKENLKCDNKTCKTKQGGEMKTIMPYSKKKFKKNESQIKVAEVATNTKDSYFCPCNQETSNQNKKTKTVKKPKSAENKKGQVLQNEDKITICSVCTNPINAKPGKKSLRSCLCTKEEVEHQPVKAGSKKKKSGKESVRSCTCPSELIGDQIAICPECQRNVEAKISKKRDKKKDGLHLHLVPEKIGDQLDVPKKKGSKKPSYSKSLPNEHLAMLDLCPLCTAKVNKQKTNTKIEDKKQSDTKKQVLQSNICPCCHVKCKPKKKVTNQDTHELKTSTVHEEPLFEMYVNQDMNILNREEVLANISSSGQESEEMKEARMARDHGKRASPVMEMVIDKNSASIINCREILKTLIEREMERRTFDEQQAEPAETSATKKTVGKQKAKSIEAAKTRNMKASENKKIVGKQKTNSVGPAETQNMKASANKKPFGKKKANSIGAAETQNRKASANKQTVGKKKEKSIDAAETQNKNVAAKNKTVGKQKTKGLGVADSQNKKASTPSRPNESKCKCCVCRKIKRPKPKEPEPKPEEEESEPPPKPIPKPIFRKLKPCICGSVVCKKDWEKIYKEQRSLQSMKKVKPCVCGSSICKEESQKMPDVLLKAARREQNAKYKAKKAIRDEKRYQKERLKRKKLYAIEDKKRYKERRRQDKLDMKKLKKYDTAPDLLMVAESLVDVGKFGAKAICDIITTACRYIRHPRDAVHNVKDMTREPGRTAKDVKKTCEGMGFFSTLARIKRRAINMRFTKKAVTKLESYPVTNYIVHMADKDPRQRMKKFKKKRTREPMDFECSLFMASLRKRPCLAVYYTCPWFYPHCVSLLGLWKQFTDVLLFILAVGVWSPCIICMELCRAMMCCCLCTG